MKKKSLIFIFVIVGFLLFPLSSLNAQVVELQWNTFLGSANNDHSWGIASDSSGNVYLTGYSNATWGTPINPHSANNDAFVACLNSSGSLVWNTFLGGSNSDYGTGIVLDSSGNIYVTGYSYDTWGTPVNAHAGGSDAFVVCLNSSGNLVWNTFMGSSDADYSYDITVDASGNLYVTGFSLATWGTPVNAHAGSSDAFVAKLDSSGNLVWSTFQGSSSHDDGRGIILVGSGNILITGSANGTWGTPVNPHSGNGDAFVACLNSVGSLLWHTFLGGSIGDSGRDIALSGSGLIFVTGTSWGTWGTPINAHSGSGDAFTAALNSSGALLWHTFLGSTDHDTGNGISLDDSGNIYLIGESESSWGAPVSRRIAYYDAFVACLNSSGHLLCNDFFGTAEEDYGTGLILDNQGQVYISGSSYETWGTPVNAHSGGSDAFVAAFRANPWTDITANGSDEPVTITEFDNLQVRVSLNRFMSSANVDYWLAYKGPSGWIHYNNTTKKWETGLGVTHQGPLMDLNNKKVFQSKLSPGSYTFYFGVDMVMDGKVTKSSLYKDEVKVTVTSN